MNYSIESSNHFSNHNILILGKYIATLNTEHYCTKKKTTYEELFNNFKIIFLNLLNNQKIILFTEFYYELLIYIEYIQPNLTFSELDNNKNYFINLIEYKINETDIKYYLCICYGIKNDEYWSTYPCETSKDTEFNNKLSSLGIDIKSDKIKKIYNIIIIYVGNKQEEYINKITDIEFNNTTNNMYIKLNYIDNNIKCRIICTKYKHIFRGTFVNNIKKNPKENDKIFILNNDNVIKHIKDDKEDTIPDVFIIGGDFNSYIAYEYYKSDDLPLKYIYKKDNLYKLAIDDKELLSIKDDRLFPLKILELIRKNFDTDKYNLNNIIPEDLYRLINLFLSNKQYLNKYMKKLDFINLSNSIEIRSYLFLFHIKYICDEYKRGDIIPIFIKLIDLVLYKANISKIEATIDEINSKLNSNDSELNISTELNEKDKLIFDKCVSIISNSLLKKELCNIYHNFLLNKINNKEINFSNIEDILYDKIFNKLRILLDNYISQIKSLTNINYLKENDEITLKHNLTICKTNISDICNNIKKSDFIHNKRNTPSIIKKLKVLIPTLNDELDQLYKSINSVRNKSDLDVIKSKIKNLEDSLNVLLTNYILSRDKYISEVYKILSLEVDSTELNDATKNNIFNFIDYINGLNKDLIKKIIKPVIIVDNDIKNFIKDNVIKFIEESINEIKSEKLPSEPNNSIGNIILLKNTELILFLIINDIKLESINSLSSDEKSHLLKNIITNYDDLRVQDDFYRIIYLITNILKISSTIDNKNHLCLNNMDPSTIPEMKLDDRIYAFQYTENGLDKLFPSSSDSSGGYDSSYYEKYFKYKFKYLNMKNNI